MRDFPRDLVSSTKNLALEADDTLCDINAGEGRERTGDLRHFSPMPLTSATEGTLADPVGSNSFKIIGFFYLSSDNGKLFLSMKCDP